MTSIPQITDRGRLIQNRARAEMRQALFLHEEVIAEIKDRLTLVNRPLSDITIVTGHPQIWQAAFPEARIIADDDTLDVQPKSQDLIIHAMALHWANDPIGQIIQCHRALRADGLFLSVSFGGQTLVELRQSLAKAEVQTLGGLSPRVAPMAELRDMGGLLQRAGLALPVADSLPLTVEYRDIFHLMHDVRDMGESNALTDRHRKPTPRKLFAEAQTVYAAEHSTAQGRLRATFELVFLLGWAPDDSQQKPLRPGSAKTSLAAALGTFENPLKD